ncbi:MULTISPECIES: hypothetical protein [Paraburkholderia]|uniref:hypothetical protein n=1 Tax=Paraburkholderia TaxID=1822464 RepID=UPI0018F3F753|nr:MULTISPECIES: hypothetical protein [Paraburkholderia]WEY37534.1 hypothetical protein P2869_10560 [Paraburkholderia sp. SUR17]
MIEVAGKDLFVWREADYRFAPLALDDRAALEEIPMLDSLINACGWCNATDI